MADRSRDCEQNKRTRVPSTQHTLQQRIPQLRHAFLGIACLSLALGLLAGCSKKKDTAADSTDSSAQTSTADAGPASLEQAQLTSECSDQGKAAGHFAEERDKGTALDEVIVGIDKSTLDPAAKEVETNIARQIYHDPFARKLNAENANNNFSMSCMAELQKKNNGQQMLTNKADIDRALSLFKTFNGSPLPDLLGQNGVTIQSLQVAPAKVPNNSGYKAGDMIYTITIAGNPSATMPCHLQKWVKGDIPPTPEFIQRGPAFPLQRAQEDDPLIYWASSGKCSPIHY